MHFVVHNIDKYDIVLPWLIYTTLSFNNIKHQVHYFTFKSHL